MKIPFKNSLKLILNSSSISNVLHIKILNIINFNSKGFSSSILIVQQKKYDTFNRSYNPSKVVLFPLPQFHLSIFLLYILQKKVDFAQFFLRASLVSTQKIITHSTVQCLLMLFNFHKQTEKSSIFLHKCLHTIIFCFRKLMKKSSLFIRFFGQKEMVLVQQIVMYKIKQKKTQKQHRNEFHSKKMNKNT